MDHETPHDRFPKAPPRIGQRPSFSAAAAAEGEPANAAQAALSPVWTPIEIPAQVPAHDAVAPLPGVRLWYWDTGGPGRPDSP